MFKNYFRIAIRNFFRQKIYSTINVTGLAIGMACFLLMILFIQFHLSFDKFHKNRDQIHLIYRECGIDGRVDNRANIGAPLAPLLLQNFPRIKNAVRFSFFNGVVLCNEKRFTEDFIFADESMFEMFTFRLQSGDVKTALSHPFSVILSQEMAEKYFGEVNPIGKVISFKTEWLKEKYDFKVTGVLQPIPENSHINFDFLVSYKSLSTMISSHWLNDHWDSGTLTYIQPQEHFHPKEFEELLVNFTEKYVDRGSYDWIKLKLLSFNELYFKPIRLSGYFFGGSGGIQPILISGILAFIILLIACVNFMNLSTARSASRAKEVGLRKVVGSGRQQLIQQFLGESLFYSFIALVLATVLVELMLPFYNNFTGLKLSVNYKSNYVFILFMIATSILVGLISGSYPSFFLSAFHPVKVLKGDVIVRSSGSLRKILVISQFSISVVLIIASIVIQKQINFLKNKDLGFNKEHVIVVPIKDRSARKNYELIKNELQKSPRIIRITAASQVPGITSQNVLLVKSEGIKDVEIGMIYTDFDYIETLELNLVNGRAPSRDIITDSKHGILMNQAALKKLNWETGIGREVELYYKYHGEIRKYYDGKIIGIIKDFNFRTLMQLVRPVIFKIDPSRFSNYFIRVDGNQIDQALEDINNIFKTITPDQPMEFYFLDEEMERTYQWFHTFGKMVRIATFMAIFIACLGLFGLAFYATESRTKEIGIRKVLGASVPSVVTLLSKDFLKLVLVGNLIAWPLAYFLISKILQIFAYRTGIGIEIFIVAALVSILIAFFTVSFQTIRTATANPVEALRYE